MKIIAGKHKNRIIPTIKTADYRPTTTKFREALFSIMASGEFFDLQPIVDAKILDLFAGTGILSFESLSRGAKNVTFVDNNPNHLKIFNNLSNSRT
jgi:16S rRNA (guanine966-N2)-methyltransferase